MPNMEQEFIPMGGAAAIRRHSEAERQQWAELLEQWAELLHLLEDILAGVIPLPADDAFSAMYLLPAALMDQAKMTLRRHHGLSTRSPGPCAD